MNLPESNRGHLSAIDLALAVMDSPGRPLDFTLLFHFREAPGIEALRVGASSARNLYPTTGSHIEGKQWVRFTQPDASVATVSVSSSADVSRVVEEFLERPIDLRTQLPVQQLVILNDTDPRVKLVTRFHHAVADGLSAAMWLGHQLRVAYGKEAPVAAAAPFKDLPLRSHPAPLRKSRFAYRGASDRLWTRHGESSGTRRWFTIKIPAVELRSECRRAGGFTYNDLLATCALEVFARWNRRHGDENKLKLGLWLPVNIRRQSAAGFGNGTGRIRLYNRYADGASIADKCRALRRQLSWSNQNGEWAVPAQAPFRFLPFWATAKLLRGYLNRPGVDMASGVFSHAERWAGDHGEVFQQVEKIESIGQLDRRYCVAINGATHQGETWLTFTYDPARWSSADIQSFVEMYQEQITLFQAEARPSGRALNVRGQRSEIRGQKSESGVTRLVLPFLTSDLRLLTSGSGALPDGRASAWGVINDGLRGMIGFGIKVLGLMLAFRQRILIRRFRWNQKRLRRRYRIFTDTPILQFGPELEQLIKRATVQAGEGARFAFTSGSTATSKRILYTKDRLRTVRLAYIDFFARCCWSLRLQHTSLYIFSSLTSDDSLTSMLIEERGLPPYLSSLQAPYRVHNHPAMQSLAAQYGTAAVRLWILAIANPGVLYSTNPSTLSTFLDELATQWPRSSQLVRDWWAKPESFPDAVRMIAKRLASRGSDRRIGEIARSEVPISLQVCAPAVAAYICWSGGYVEPFLDRIANHLPAARYRQIPMYSMSTETLETIGCFEGDRVSFLPLASQVLYEFIEEGVEDRPGNLRTADQLEMGKVYSLVVSDPFGLRRYQTGDLFLCDGFVSGLPDLRFMRRRDLEYSFTGEKLTSEHVMGAFQTLRAEYALGSDTFLTCVPSQPADEPIPHYKIILVESGTSVRVAGNQIAERCDELFSEVNREYRSKHQSGRLGRVRFMSLTPSEFIASVGGSRLNNTWEAQFKFLPLYRRTWESMKT